MYDSILVPVDNSETSRHALTHAIELATAVDATVHVLHVMSVSESSKVDIQRIEQGHLYTDLRDAGEELIESLLVPANDEAVPITRHVMVGRPDKQILKYIHTESPDLVIMGSRGKTGLGRFIVGSVAENVARRSSVPVQLIQPSDKEIPKHIFDS